MIEQESFQEDNQGIEIDFRPVTRRVSTDAPLIGRNSWYNDMCRRIPDTNTGTFKDIFRNPYEDGRPLTYFLYLGLTWDKLETFLHRQNATIECIERAEVNLKNYNYQRMMFIERKLMESKKQNGIETIQSEDDNGARAQSEEVEEDNQSGYDRSSQLEDGQESSESEHERSSTLSTEYSQSGEEVEYDVLQNEELHGALELDKYRLHVYEEEDIQTAVNHGSAPATGHDPASLKLKLVSDGSDQDDDVGGEQTGKPPAPLNNNGVDQPSETNLYSDVQVVQAFEVTKANSPDPPTEESEDAKEEHSESLTEVVSKNINSDFNNSLHVGESKGQTEGHSDPAEGDVNIQSKDDDNNQSEDDDNNQSDDEGDNQSEGDVSSHSDGTFGSCHSDRENELSDGEHEFIGSYKSDDTYTSCHSDEMFMGSTEETTKHTGSTGQRPVRIIKPNKSPIVFRPK